MKTQTVFELLSALAGMHEVEKNAKNNASAFRELASNFGQVAKNAPLDTISSAALDAAEAARDAAKTMSRFADVVRDEKLVVKEAFGVVDVTELAIEEARSRLREKKRKNMRGVARNYGGFSSGATSTSTTC